MQVRPARKLLHQEPYLGCPFGQALKQIAFPDPHIHMSPDARRDQLVGLTTWLSVDAGDLGTKHDSVTAGAPGSAQTVEATLGASKVDWDMGDGSRFTCENPTPYDPQHPNAPTNCSYTWSHSSASEPAHTYTVTATITWVGTYQVTGPGGGFSGTAGPITRTSSVNVTVAEAQSINNG